MKERSGGVVGTLQLTSHCFGDRYSSRGVRLIAAVLDVEKATIHEIIVAGVNVGSVRVRMIFPALMLYE